METTGRKPAKRKITDKAHSFIKAFGLLNTAEMKGYNYKKALNRASLWER